MKTEYRDLFTDESIQEGDEYFETDTVSWNKLTGPYGYSTGGFHYRRPISPVQSEPNLLSEAREHARLLELTLRQLGQLHPESAIVFILLANQANGIASACLELGPGDGFFRFGKWIDYQCRADIFRGGGILGSWYYVTKNDTAHTYPWRRRKIEEVAKSHCPHCGKDEDHSRLCPFIGF